MAQRGASVRQMVLEELRLRGSLHPFEVAEIPVVTPGQAMRWRRERYSAQAPERQNYWLYERHYWKLAYQDLRLAQQLLDSPIAGDRREGLAVANQLCTSPFLIRYAPTMPPQIVDGFIVPFLDSALSEDWQEISRVQLLQNACAIYLKAQRRTDSYNALRALIAAADPVNREMADWARFTLGNKLEQEGQVIQGAVLLEAVTSIGLREHSQQLARKWRE